MQDPLARATSQPPATLGEGCVSRYDPAELTSKHGAEFAGAAELWRQLQESPALAAELEVLNAVLTGAKTP
ncbi:MAG: hypothetical protein A2Y50_05105 [Pseudomonadales bacterium RIFCSPLOWO2_12_59_9]|nr:hypothetical protein [Pseudomonas sp.]OHC29367.1 MAG: hypothetical protein A2Y50_05105 [Pseudomonadales bacterium RIFCSPLOWO2_12_59_9]